MSGFAQVILALAALVSACGVTFSSIMAVINHRSISNVHDEVRTQNGITMGAFADLQEGRRIQADIPRADRTDAEQVYVEGVESPAGQAHAEALRAATVQKESDV